MKRFKKTLEAKESEAERAFLTRWLQLNTMFDDEVPMYREYKFTPARNWRFDFCWPEQRVAVEIEGGVYMRVSGHTSAAGYQKDCAKYNAAIEAGWVVLRYTPQMVERYPEACIRQIEAVIRSRS